MWNAIRGWDRAQWFMLPALALAAILLAGMVLHLVKEEPRSNSYALLADSFLHGKLDSAQCFDSDCVIVDGKSYVIFPPVPAVVAMPFVAAFGTDFHGFAAIGFACLLGSVFLWWRIFGKLGVEKQTAVWLLLALAFGSPLFYVSIRADRVWFFAQSINFLLLSLAMYEVMRGGRIMLAGAYLGLAFLSRQMTILLAPFLYVLALRPEENLISFKWPSLKRALAFGTPLIAAVAVYMAYNMARFGAPMETGYIYIAKPTLDHWSLINERLVHHGLFSKDYFLFNAFHLFIQGFHVEWGGPALLTPLKLDPMGTSLLAASPFVLLALFVPLDRETIIGGFCAALILGITLFYHGNGFSQYNAQRFVLDWAPVLFFVLGLSVSKALRPALAVLVIYAMGLNVVAMALLATLHQG